MNSILNKFSSLIRGLVFFLTVISGLGIIFMMFITCLDIILRIVGYPIIGVYDIIKVSSAITISCALPYTTAVKGHVSVEYFFHKLNRRGRVIVDTVTRVLTMTFFGLLAYRCFQYGIALYNSGEATSTLQIPTFWVMYVISFSCVIVVFVIFEHLLHPGKEMIKP